VSCNTVARALVLSRTPDRLYKVEGHHLVGARSYGALLCVTRGYFNTRPCCNLVHENTLTLLDGTFSTSTVPSCPRHDCPSPKEKKRKPRPKPTRHCVRGCKKKEKDAAHFCFEMDDDYGSYSTCEHEPLQPVLECTECDCYDLSGVLYPAGHMEEPRKERLFTFPAPRLELSNACGELDQCRTTTYTPCKCRHCAADVEMLVPDGCGFAVFKKHCAPEWGNRNEPDEVDGKYECYTRVCVTLCPTNGRECRHPRCAHGRHHAAHCNRQCHDVIADVVCERSECIKAEQASGKDCLAPAKCIPCDKRMCSGKRCARGYHHHHLCDMHTCQQTRQHKPPGPPLPTPGTLTGRVGKLGFHKGRDTDKGCHETCEHGMQRRTHV
jgi:hypothetical protein